MKDISIYFHYPFCLRKCYYCDFVSLAGSYDNRVESAYLKSLELYKDFMQDRTIKTLFFGGGTPSLMPNSVLETIFKQLDLSACKEVSIEVNPATVDEEKLKFFKDIGINRISIGVQAMNDKDLKVLGRLHSIHQALDTIDLARKYFSNISADFIYARPEQTVQAWQQELKQIKSLDLPHISLYQLTIENGWKVEIPDDDIAEDMFKLNCAEMSEYKHYEISNYAKSGYESEHNLAYWRYKDYLGFGASAHSRVEGKALVFTSNVHKWLETPVYRIEELSPQAIFTEKVLMGLRTTEGAHISVSDYEFIDRNKLEEFISQGLLEFNNDNLSSTERGMLINDYIVQQILL